MSYLKKIAIQFQQSDLTSGQKTFTHNFNNLYVKTILADNNGIIVSEDNYSIKSIDANNIQIKMFFNITGTYTLTINSGTMLDGTGSQTQYQKYVLPFTNALLISGKLNINHGLSSQSLSIKLYNNLQQEQNLANFVIQPIDLNNVQIDLSRYGTLSGTWVIVIRLW